jgi:hypothetical protein
MGIISILIGLVALVCVLGGIYWYKRKVSISRKPLQQIAEDHDVHIPHQFINKVVSYIDASLALGYSTQDIYQHLKTLKWTEEQINDAFKRFELLGAYHQMRDDQVPETTIKAKLSKDYKPEQIRATLTHHAAILGKNASADDQINHLTELAKTHEVHEADTKISKLAKFVKQCYVHGYPKEIITRMLTAKGWAQEHIENAFSTIMKQ